ncbi:hypothetical protein OIPHN260_07190 [Enterobacter roggenkampii]|uniref:Threonine/Serine exporter ThrE domain-containing protein n=1 Tax=Enterobacter roggenkampii TaxID=1812935 RepID=A0AAU9BNH1_9ENTR|nr:hypothetical protein OIPHN260_07190 [Enterobacter roggenkampii]
MGVIDFLLALAQDMLLAAIPAVGFAMVFNVPQRALPWCALLGAIGHGSRMVMMTAGFNIEWSTFMASMLVGSIGIQWSRWYLADAPRDKCAHFREINGTAAAFQYLQKNYNPTASSFLRPSTGKYR